ncbi:MAG: YIP1 family protein [Anaerolineae bacterium]|nr:YIP1 family protein [Anaerolineae bacterium]
MDRIVGVLTLKPPVYRGIAEDSSATGMAAIIVAIVSLINSAIGAFVVPGLGIRVPSILGGVGSSNPIMDVVMTVVLGLVGWALFSVVIGFGAKLLGGKSSIGKMLRVFGFASIFLVVGTIPCLGILGMILGIVATIIGLREAAEFSTGKAIATGVIGFIVFAVLAVILGVVLGMILGPTGMIG